MSTIPKEYRKKPIVIEALQYIDRESATTIIDWALDSGDNIHYWCGNGEECRKDSHVLRIPTLEGNMDAAPGDFIIKGVNGEFYPCKPDIFAKTYESAEVGKATHPRTISELQALAYKQSADKGFHDDEPTEGRALQSLNAERIALMHSELSEALEELRSGIAPYETYYAQGNPKPEGVPSELADVVIRVLDFCGANDIDLESMITEKLAYNATRAHKHGKKF